MLRIAVLVVLVASVAVAQFVPEPQSKKSALTSEITGHLIRCDVEAFVPQARALATALRRLGVAGAEVVQGDREGVFVEITKGKTDGQEAYRIEPGGGRLVVTADTAVGVARATATLAQSARIEGTSAIWPHIHVTDAPDRPFRCFMVDMGRNPHSPAVLRHIVDAAWFYKVNYLQLHLTDDQLFSWPSRAYPKLYSKRAGWTWNDFVALEAYSQARGVTIIPELEVPGHSTILRRTYPEAFGKTTTDLASQRESRKAVETLLGELLSVFKATPYLHIGGDEAYGVPTDIQRDFINHLNRYVRGTDRRTLVWEGPHLGKGDNKVDTSVIHMNWRTINFPAQQMLDAGYEVINAAWDPLYIVDHYPKTMFTAVDVRRCYDWDIRRFAHVNHGFPTFAKPHRTKTDQGLLGFCMPWWEGREENVLGLCIPRLAAVASAAWNRAGENSFASFYLRQKILLQRLEKIAGFSFPKLPLANRESQVLNLAFRAKVTASSGSWQPVFGPQRLTNGIPDRFDHFLGFPTQPDPLEIVITLRRPESVTSIVVYETAVGGSHEIYDLFVSPDGKSWEKVGSAGKGSRGKKNHVMHTFDRRTVHSVKIVTQGCHGLTFPSFSRLTEVMVYRE